MNKPNICKKKELKHTKKSKKTLFLFYFSTHKNAQNNHIFKKKKKKLHIYIYTPPTLFAL